MRRMKDSIEMATLPDWISNFTLNPFRKSPGSTTSTCSQAETDNSKFLGPVWKEVDDETGALKFVVTILNVILEKGNGLKTDSLYRASGGQTDINNLIDSINSKQQCENQVQRVNDRIQNILMKELNIHVLAGVLKLFLTNLEEPLLDYNEFKNILNESDFPDIKHIEKIRQVFNTYPKNVNDVTLLYILRHLTELLSYRENKMSALALGVVFGPVLMRTTCEDATGMIIQMKQQSILIEFILTNSVEILRINTAESFDRKDFSNPQRTLHIHNDKLYSPASNEATDIRKKIESIETQLGERQMKGFNKFDITEQSPSTSNAHKYYMELTQSKKLSYPAQDNVPQSTASKTTDEPTGKKNKMFKRIKESKTLIKSTIMGNQISNREIERQTNNQKQNFVKVRYLDISSSPPNKHVGFK